MSKKNRIRSDSNPKVNGMTLTAEEVHALEGVPESQRQSILERLVKRHERYGLKEGEQQERLPPDPPPNWGRQREVGKGGAISPELAKIGVDVTTPDVMAAERAVEEVQVSAKSAKLAKRSSLTELDSGLVIRIPDWDTVDVQEGQQVIGYIQNKLNEGAQILAQRIGQQTEQRGYRCTECTAPIPRAEAAVMIRAFRDPQTGIITNLMWCSNKCFLTSEAHGAPRRGVPGSSLTTRNEFNADGTVRQ